MLTVSGTFVTGLGPSVRYSVETFGPLSDTQTGVAGPWDIPHALTRFGSVISARPDTSDTRSCSTNLVGGPSCARTAAPTPIVISPATPMVANARLPIC